MTEEQIAQVLDQHANQLSERLGGPVQILVSFEVRHGTASYYRGIGNWHARLGMAHDFIRQDECDTMARILRQHLPETGEGCEEDEP